MELVDIKYMLEGLLEEVPLNSMDDVYRAMNEDLHSYCDVGSGEGLDAIIEWALQCKLVITLLQVEEVDSKNNATEVINKYIEIIEGRL